MTYCLIASSLHQQQTTVSVVQTQPVSWCTSNPALLPLGIDWYLGLMSDGSYGISTTLFLVSNRAQDTAANHSDDVFDFQRKSMLVPAAG